MGNDKKIICPLCSDTVDKLLYRFHIDDERNVIEKIRQQNPSWTENDGACSRCVDYYQTAIIREQRILPQIGPYFPVKSADDFIILPTPLRIDANPRYTGKGVTICFIDSGFYPHPDLVANKNRIKKYVDITGSTNTLSFEEGLGEVVDSSWHGTMTTVVCAGDGYLSKGLYKAIALDAELVLIKVQDETGKISTDNIVKALQWVLENHEVYDIRIVNMSFGDDELLSYRTSRVDQLAERLIEKNIVVVAAVGNDENGNIHPPANSLNVIAIGGIDDNNDLENGAIKSYHSTYGITMDALLKPELVAHAIWIAAPILPNTKEQKEATALYHLVDWLSLSRMSQPGNETVNQPQEYIHQTQLNKEILTWDAADIRKAIIQRIQTCKYISPDYMHVDGTSFAAPIVSSVVAQLLEANPSLSVRDIRNILFSTAKRIESIASERQGFGIIQPRKAILKALRKENIIKLYPSPFINAPKNTIEFFIENTCAEEISLAGSFNHWANDVLLMEPAKNGFWKIEIPMLPAGKYQYKFLIDHKHWMEDVDNPYREPDGFNGFNSIFIVEYQN
jgi:serine protease AprX